MKKLLTYAIALTFLIFNLAYAGLNDGLLAHYPFDGDANDITGNGFDGIVYGATSYSDRFGNEEKCYKFDGENNYIEVSKILPDMNNATVAFWIYIETFDSKGYGRFVFIDGDYTGAQDFDLRLNSNNRTYFNTKGRDQHLMIEDNHIITNEWIHMTLIADDENDKKSVWINGKRIKEIDWKDTANVKYHYKLNIGRIHGGFCCPFMGLLDDFRIYDRALTEEEVQQLFNNKPNDDNTCIDSDQDGVPDIWDHCPNTPEESYTNRYGCIENEHAAVSGRILMKGIPVKQGTAMLIQSGEIHQKSNISSNGGYHFNKLAEEKPFSVIIRKKTNCPIDCD